ncbi:unnamed protein product [Heterobilharzia americana]|nr:unnamed protein product [Heterobilharzia americana]
MEQLDLSYNNFENDGILLVKSILDKFAFVTKINLSGNSLNQEAYSLIQSILSKNTHMNTLILKDTGINDECAVMIANGLRMNTRLTKLDLSRNNIMSDGGYELAKAMSNRLSLEWVSLHWNKLSSKGAYEFGNMLEFNTSLRYLDLSWNGFTGKSLENLGRGLTRNCHLEELNLKCNRIDLKGVITFADSLYTNKMLKRLRLGLNPLTMAGIHELINVIENSTTCVLEELDLEGLTINENISQQVYRIGLRRSFTLKATGCIRWEPRRGKYSKTDAITFLINYLNRHGMRLLDLYHLLDPQQTGVISSAQFIDRMTKSQIPLTLDDLQTLIKYIDAEGTDKITYKLLANQVRLFVRPEGPDAIDKPPRGFPSKMQTTGSNLKKHQVSRKSRTSGTYHTSKTVRDMSGQSKKRFEVNQTDETYSTIKCSTDTTAEKENKVIPKPMILNDLNYNSEKDFLWDKESGSDYPQVKNTP